MRKGKRFSFVMVGVVLLSLSLLAFNNYLIDISRVLHRDYHHMYKMEKSMAEQSKVRARGIRHSNINFLQVAFNGGTK